MATITPAIPQPEAPTRSDRVILRDIPWDLYVRLRDIDANRHTRMAYHNGTLELMSLQSPHERYANRLGLLVWVVTEELDIPCTGARSTTLQRPGEAPKKGSGKEPDTSFYIANEARIRDNDQIDLAVDPPPDLAVEVDYTADSERKLPIYAALGVPEVWRYDVETRARWFGQLQPDGTYAPIPRSVSLPMLTPELVLDALKRCEGIPESRWTRLLRAWVRDEVLPRYRDEMNC